MPDDEEDRLVRYLLDNSDFIKKSFGREDDEGRVGASATTVGRLSSYEFNDKAIRKRDYGNRRRPSHAQMRAREPLPCCSCCGSGDVVKDERHGDAVCRNCATCHRDALVDDAFRCMLYGDYCSRKATVEGAQRRNVYSKDAYFHSLLQLACGRQSRANVPESVWTKVARDAAAREGEDITASRVRDVLKKHRLSSMYKHAWYICLELRKKRGRPVRVLDHREEDLVKYVFARYRAAFARIRGARKNGLNYNYVMFQAFRLINRDDLCVHVPLIKCRARMTEHENVWRRVCEMCGWMFLAVMEGG